MQFRQLEIFLAVARNNSFSKAADAMMLAQPTVSSHIHALEAELDAKLFVRSTKGLRLTPQGQLFYTYASQIVNFSERAQTELRAMDEAHQNTLTVSASTVPAQYLLPAILPIVQRRHPKTRFRLRQGDSATAVSDVVNGDAEIAIVGSDTSKPNLQCLPLMTERLVVAAPDTPYFRSMQGVIGVDVLQNFPFLAREEGSGTRRNMETLLRGRGVSLERMQIVAELPSTECVLRCVENGLGISIVSKLAADSFLSSGRILLFSLDGPLSERRFYLVVREDVPLSPAARCMMEAFQSMDSVEI